MSLSSKRKTVKLIIIGASVVLVVYSITTLKYWWNDTKVDGENTILRQIYSPGVIVESTGPYGDQLFKYAVSLAVAKSLNAPLYLVEGNHSEDSEYEVPICRKNSVEYKSVLQLFHLPLGKWVQAESINLTAKNVWQMECSDAISGMTDIQAHLSSEFVSISQVCESEEYFKSVSEEIKLQLSPHVPWGSKAYIAWKDNIDEVNSNRGRLNSFIGPRTSVAVIIDTSYRVLPINYYKRGMHFIEQKFKGSREVIFFVFSDDMNYVKANLVPPLIENGPEEELNFKLENVFLVSGSEVEETVLNFFEEFVLSLLCKNMIVSDSSESWWTAFLSNNNDNKIVIAPKQVSNTNYEHDNNTISVLRRQYPKEWIELDLIY